MTTTPRIRVRAGAAAATAAFIAATAACGADPGGGGDRVRVGFLASLSGTYQSVGTDMRAGFELYLSTHDNKLGGRPVDLVVADEGDGPATAVPAATRLIKQDRVVALAGVVGGGSVAGIIPLTSESKIPFIGANARPQVKDTSWVWHTSFVSDEPGIAIAAYVKQRVGDGTVYAIGPDYQGGWDELRGFTDTYTAAGGKLANPGGKTTFTPFPQTSNFVPYLAKIRQSGAEAVYTFYAGKAAVDFVTQYAQSDLRNVPLYAAGFLTEGSVLPAQGQAAKGIRNVLNYSPDLDNPVNRAFVAAWKTAGRDGLPTTYAMAAYDAAAVLDKAIAAIDGPVTPEAINTAIAGLGRIDSPRGAWQFNKTPGAHYPIQKWYLREVRLDGQALSNVLVQDLATLGNN